MSEKKQAVSHLEYALFLQKLYHYSRNLHGKKTVYLQHGIQAGAEPSGRTACSSRTVLCKQSRCEVLSEDPAKGRKSILFMPMMNIS
jgi:hypothetical protein